ncbi:hypothetical protein WMY93_001559 [Mugilogobius chulae]|uniref:Integrase catalytic domain-containing protein n=1 Tax=Mugilogobius chulae TaxID=88201 RepID=A0AAW0Q2K6_9GOBI
MSEAREDKVSEAGENKVSEAREKVSEAGEDKVSVRSEKSRTSKGTSRSSASIAALNARAKAEAARKRAQYAKIEIEMQVKKAELKVEETRIEATLQALQQEREAEAAHAEAVVFETAANDIEEVQEWVPQNVDTSERTFNYVKNQLILKQGTSPFDSTEYNVMPNVTFNLPKQDPAESDTRSDTLPHTVKKQESPYQPPKGTHKQKVSPDASPKSEREVCPQQNDISDIARFLAKRELLTGGLRKFSDNAGDYWGWKSSFENVIRDLNLTSSEKFDLLIKWLGAESVKYANRLRAVYINNPTEGLAKVWERLNECYGSPEALERALLDRLEHFPKISNKDPHLLRELQDLLLEIDAVKSEALHPGPAPTASQATVTATEPAVVDGGESSEPLPTAISTCTQVCGSEVESHSCAKICLVFIYPKSSPEKKLKAYALLDDQSNRSLARSTVFDTFGITKNSFPYKLRTCAGLEEATGRRAYNFVVESADCKSRLELQTLIECDMLPDNRNEIPTAEAARHHSHLQEIAAEIQNLTTTLAYCFSSVGMSYKHTRSVPDFMQSLFDNGHAEIAPPLSEEEECWYLPFFGVYHPRKPEQIRVVFDSSAQHNGVSLNDVLLTGPNLNNSLLGVLMRLREETVAVTADIKQMFHCFVVREDHRNFLRFLWHQNNDMNQPIVEYRMTVHVFGNSPSPAVATYGLRKASEDQDKEDNTTQRLVERHFYVDDGLVSFPSSTEAISVMQNAQETLASSNLRLHKIASNDITVMKAFPKDDLANGLKDLDLGSDLPPMQRSLGISWDIATDQFTFQVSTAEKPYTRRGVLSVVNSLYDPLGFAAPVSIKGRALLRELSTDTCQWDEPLPEKLREEWSLWRESLKYLEEVRIPRMYTSISFSGASWRSLSQANMQSDEAQPVIIPGNHHLTTLLIRHYHQKVQHQGRHFTEGAVRSAGFWIVGGKRSISSIIHHCVTCRKLRWNTETQKMSDLPVDRVTVCPPFTYVGVDVFGPWTISSRRTRGGLANSKRWAVIFTCLGTRAIHVEVIETMESSSFINALRRFISIRGPVKQLRSDCGTNFLGACKELGITAKHCNNQEIQDFLTKNECTWVFNPPHSPHMGGSWERMIGIVKRILDSMLTTNPVHMLPTKFS